MKRVSIAAVLSALTCVVWTGCNSEVGSHEASGHEGHASEAHAHAGHHEHKIVVTSPLRKDVISTQQYVCQIHSCKHIEVRALQRGYLEEICVKEGQAVKKGQLMFKLLPIVYQAKLASEQAEVERIKIELDNAQALAKKGYVSTPEIALKSADLAKAQANLQLARAELSFASVTAPFDGIVDRQRAQLGSLIDEGDILTTLSDNNLMWVYFNVPEARYLAYKADLDNETGVKQANYVSVSNQDDKDGADDDDEDDDEKDDDDDRRPDADKHLRIELKLANGKVFPHKGAIGAIEADFDNTTGNISFRADFPNPDGLLRNGQTGTILIHNALPDAVVIPQRATFEILAKQYVFVVDKENVVHQRDITVQVEQDDIYVIAKGLNDDDRIILEGIRQVRDGDKITFEYHPPEAVFDSLKFHAE